MADALATQVIKGGGRVLFLDLKKAKNDSLYLTLTSLGRGRDGQEERRTVTVFGDMIDDLKQSLSALIKAKAAL